MTLRSRSHQVTKLIANEQGVTLMEAMIYLAIAGMLLATAVTAFLAQNKSYNRQDVIAEIQQNIRGASELLVSDIRFAGFNHPDDAIDPFVIATTSEIEIEYWTDLNSDGLYDDDETTTVNYEVPAGTTDLVRTINSVPSVVSENIERFRFEYMLESGGTISWVGNPTLTQIDNIVAVKIIFLGSARPAAFNPAEPSKFFPPIEGSPPEGEWVTQPNTGYKRMVSVIAQCRNCGS